MVAPKIERLLRLLLRKQTQSSNPVLPADAFMVMIIGDTDFIRVRRRFLITMLVRYQSLVSTIINEKMNIQLDQMMLARGIGVHHP